ncbi:hypothetical protein BS17DRAFT_772650 [Gyrodon lividus]|nr:hypothetical protein BS17DRAFT_772650 [Gyrodon lividus]
MECGTSVLKITINFDRVYTPNGNSIRRTLPANQVAPRATANNLCRIDWMEDNLTGTSRQFDNYWKKLSAVEKELETRFKNGGKH